MSIRPEMTVSEVAFEVGTVLAEASIEAILSGGGAATIYAPEAYQTRDLDFILMSRRASGLPILALGFRTIPGTGMYDHPDIPFTLEFPPGPLAVGDEVITSWEILRDGERTLSILTPTDCVRDRLAAAIHWRDRASLVQAAAVAKRQKIDLDRVRTWCVAEGGERTFEDFMALLDRF